MSVISEKDIRKTDILIGKGNKCARHIGTVAFKSIAEANVSTYMDEASSSCDRRFVTVEIVESILTQGGRFLTQTNTGSGQWVEMDKRKAREKVRTVLSNAVKKRSKRGLQRPPSVGTVLMAIHKSSQGFDKKNSFIDGVNKLKKQRLGPSMSKPQPPTLAPLQNITRSAKFPQLWIAPAPDHHETLRQMQLIVTSPTTNTTVFDRCLPMIIQVPPPPASIPPPLPPPSMTPSTAVIAPSAPSTVSLPPVQQQQVLLLPQPTTLTPPATTTIAQSAAPTSRVSQSVVQQQVPLLPRATIFTPSVAMTASSFAATRVSPVVQQQIEDPLARRSTMVVAASSSTPTKVSPSVQQLHDAVDGQYENSDLRPTDILVGRGNHCNYHLGTIAFKLLIHVNLAAYMDTEMELCEKTHLIMQVVDCIYKGGGRFLKKESSNKRGGVWLEIDRELARAKVSQRFRTAQKAIMRPSLLFKNTRIKNFSISSKNFDMSDSFGDILDVISRDPALLQSLSSATSAKNKGARTSSAAAPRRSGPPKKNKK